MRRREAKKERKKQVFMSLFIVVIMTSSVIGYMFGKDSSVTTKYNDYKFKSVNDRWITKVNNKELLFHYFPDQVDNLNISNEIITKLKNTVQIDLTSDPEDEYKGYISLAEFDFFNNLKYNNQFIRVGFTKENIYNFSIITCETATPLAPVILLKKSNQTKVYQQDNCIIVESRTEQDFIALKDRIIYGIVGIII